MLRGKDDRGENLVIAREYIAHGLRERAARIVTLDLGPRTDLEIEERLRSDTSEERLTAIDRRLIRDRDEARIVSASDADSFQQSLRVGRLQKLRAMGLAEPVGGDRWQLADGLEETLRRMGERGDIIRTMQRELTVRRLDRAAADQCIFDPTAEGATPIVGRVVLRGLADELHDRHYLIVDGVDGRTHYAAIGKGEMIDPTPVGSIVRIAPRETGIRPADRTKRRAVMLSSSLSLSHLRFDAMHRHACDDTVAVWEAWAALDTRLNRRSSAKYQPCKNERLRVAAAFILPLSFFLFVTVLASGFGAVNLTSKGGKTNCTPSWVLSDQSGRKCSVSRLSLI